MGGGRVYLPVRLRICVCLVEAGIFLYVYFQRYFSSSSLSCHPLPLPMSQPLRAALPLLTHSFAASIGHELGLSHREVTSLTQSVTEQLKALAAVHFHELELHYSYQEQTQQETAEHARRAAEEKAILLAAAKQTQGEWFGKGGGGWGGGRGGGGGSAGSESGDMCVLWGGREGGRFCV